MKRTIAALLAGAAIAIGATTTPADAAPATPNDRDECGCHLHWTPRGDGLHVRVTNRSGAPQVYVFDVYRVYTNPKGRHFERQTRVVLDDGQVKFTLPWRGERWVVLTASATYTRTGEDVGIANGYFYDPTQIES